MAIRFFIEYENTVIQFPVNPPEIKVSSSSANDTTTIIKLGDINVLSHPQLRETEFESFLPRHADYPFVVTKGEFKEPEFYIDFINKIRSEKKPCRFIVSDTKINMLASIEDFEYGYQSGDHEDIYFSISFKEYRPYAAKEVKISVDKSKLNPPVNKQGPSTTKKVTSGCNVIVNGRLHRDSWGKGPGKTLRDYKGKINFVKGDNRAYPYHVTTPNGSWMGWVTKGSVKVL